MKQVTTSSFLDAEDLRSSQRLLTNEFVAHASPVRVNSISECISPNEALQSRLFSSSLNKGPTRTCACVLDTKLLCVQTMTDLRTTQRTSVSRSPTSGMLNFSCRFLLMAFDQVRLFRNISVLIHLRIGFALHHYSVSCEKACTGP